MLSEAGEYFHDEVIRISADDKNKVNVGTLAVSRYHQISHFFMTIVQTTLIMTFPFRDTK